MNNMLSHHPNYVHSRGPGQWTFANLGSGNFGASVIIDRKSTRLNSSH